MDRQGTYHSLLIQSTTAYSTAELEHTAQAVAATLTNSTTQPIVTLFKNIVQQHKAIKIKTTANRINPLLNIANVNRLLVGDKNVKYRSKTENIGINKALQAAQGNLSKFKQLNTRGNITTVQHNHILKSISNN